MSFHTANLIEPHWTNVRDRVKNLELRPERSTWARVRVGDKIIFSRKTEGEAAQFFDRKVENVVGFRNFSEAVKEYGVRLMPNLSAEPEKILEAYLDIGDYREWEGPVVVFHLQE